MRSCLLSWLASLPNWCIPYSIIYVLCVAYSILSHSRHFKIKKKIVKLLHPHKCFSLPEGFPLSFSLVLTSKHTHTHTHAHNSDCLNWQSGLSAKTPWALRTSISFIAIGKVLSLGNIVLKQGIYFAFFSQSKVKDVVNNLLWPWIREKCSIYSSLSFALSSFHFPRTVD